MNRDWVSDRAAHADAWWLKSWTKYRLALKKRESKVTGQCSDLDGALHSIGVTLTKSSGIRSVSPPSTAVSKSLTSKYVRPLLDPGSCTEEAAKRKKNGARSREGVTDPVYAGWSLDAEQSWEREFTNKALCQEVWEVPGDVYLVRCPPHRHQKPLAAVWNCTVAVKQLERNDHSACVFHRAQIIKGKWKTWD